MFLHCPGLEADLMADIKELMDRVSSGDLSAHECGEILAKRFRVVAARPRTEEEIDELERRCANGEIDEFTPGGLDELNLAYASGRITDHDYATIFQAIAPPTGDRSIDQ